MVALLECGIWEELTSGPYVMFGWGWGLRSLCDDWGGEETGALYSGPYVMFERRQEHFT